MIHHPRCGLSGIGVAAAVAVLTGLAGLGLTCGPGEDPCDDDRLGCAAAQDSFDYIACPELGPLTVTLGAGQNSFRTVSEASPPEIEFGFQGGQHVFLGFRVGDVQLDLDPKIRVTMWLAEGEDCSPGAPTNEVPIGCQSLGIRQVVMGGRVPLQVAGDVVEESGLLLFVDPPSRGRHVVSVEVEDVCGRLASDSLIYTYGEH